MPHPKQYRVLRRALNSPSSQLETFRDDSMDCFTRATAPRFNGLTYAQAVELRIKRPEEYEALFRESNWD